MIDRTNPQIPQRHTFPAPRGRAGQPEPRAENRERGKQIHFMNPATTGMAIGPMISARGRNSCFELMMGDGAFS